MSTIKTFGPVDERSLAQVTDARSQQILEYPLIRARLADHTAFPPSRRLAEALPRSRAPAAQDSLAGDGTQHV